MHITVSYLLPSYNHAKYLPAFLESLVLEIEQLDVLAEVIIIDDGSQDNSADILRSWMEKNKHRFKIQLSIQENKGLPAVLNRLVFMAEGKYLRLCASDDILIIGGTSALLMPFQNAPDILCAIGDAIVIDEHDHVIHESSVAYHGGRVQRLEKQESIRHELISHWCVAGPTILIKKDYYKNFYYNEAAKIDDFDLFLSLLSIPNSVFFIDKKVSYYRIHSTNTSKTQNVEKRIENLTCFVLTINKYINKAILLTYLYPLKYKSMAKISFLKKRYFKCFIELLISGIYKIKCGFK